MYFKFIGGIYIQLDDVVTIRALLANVFMCSLQEAIVPAFKGCLVHWKR